MQSGGRSESPYEVQEHVGAAAVAIDVGQIRDGLDVQILFVVSRHALGVAAHRARRGKLDMPRGAKNLHATVQLQDTLNLYEWAEVWCSSDGHASEGSPAS